MNNTTNNTQIGIGNDINLTNISTADDSDLLLGLISQLEAEIKRTVAEPERKSAVLSDINEMKQNTENKGKFRQCLNAVMDKLGKYVLQPSIEALIKKL